MIKDMIKIGNDRVKIDTIFGYFIANGGVVFEIISNNTLKSILIQTTSTDESDKIISNYDLLLLKDKILVGTSRIKIDSIFHYCVSSSTNKYEIVIDRTIDNNIIFPICASFECEEDRDADLIKLDKLFVSDPITESRKLKIIELNKN